MLFYSHLLYAAASDPRNFEDLECKVGILTPKEAPVDLLSISCKYKGTSDSHSVVQATRSPVQRNMTLARLLTVNMSVREVARSVVTILERWLAEKPYRKRQGIFNVRLENGMFWKDMTCTAEIVLKVQFDEMVKSKMKWPDEPELTEGILK
jgi:hypothetical protein